MKNSSKQSARRSACVDTDKTSNAGEADFSYLPEGLKPQGANRCALAMLTRCLPCLRLPPYAWPLVDPTRSPFITWAGP